MLYPPLFGEETLSFASLFGLFNEKFHCMHIIGSE